MSRHGVPGEAELPAPSSLLSSRWSRDNLITGHPARLYNGRVRTRLDADSVAALLGELEERRGPIQVGAARMGVFTWDVACADGNGPFVLQVPLLLDEVGARGRARHDVPRRNVEIMRAFAARGLTRFVVTPRETVTLGDGVPAALFDALPDHHPLGFGHGSLHVQLAEDPLSWLISLGPQTTAHLLAEMVAALVYHYDPDADGGTVLADVAINDGDFVARRRADGGFDVRLTAARYREGGVAPSRLLLYLIQMLAYEDWSIDGGLVGLPTLVSNPAVAFEGTVRGLRYRYADLGLPEEEGARQALGWIRDFGRAREGRGYRAFTERFLAGALPLAFGGDPREHWWRLIPLQIRRGVRELRARQQPTSSFETGSARALKTLLDRLARELGRLPDDDPTAVRLNDLGRVELLALLAEAAIPPAVADELLAGWPYRSLDHLLARVPAARGLRRLKSRLSFGRAVPDDQQGTTASLGPPPSEAPRRALANPELFGALPLDPEQAAAAARAFPTFEAYMDAALHDPIWGYYTHTVTIGRAGHFNTNPESLSPRYGGWVAAWAFRLWREMVQRGELAESDPFPIIEFGAGNGRLARDLLDAVARKTDDPRARAFAAAVRYHVYETSPLLRERQRALLGPGAVVGPGDARRPAETLARDFPGGVKGLVLTNEVPDAFGVHKLVLAADGQAWAALVVPRLAPAPRAALGEPLVRRMTEVDRALRQTFALAGNDGDLYLDSETWAAVMAALPPLPAEEREALRDALWFEEAYVPVSVIPMLAAHLTANADQYATALAAEESGVVVYVNVHASRFIRELGGSLAAGFVVTIDYGDTTWGLIQGARRGDFPFRVYGDWQDYVPRPNDPYAAPGTQDLTADVSFSDLARAGQAAGLTVVHYGPERDLTGDELPALLREAEEDEALVEFLGNPVFKVLVLGTRASDALTTPLATPLPLYRREQDLPKARRPMIRPLIAAIKKGLLTG